MHDKSHRNVPVTLLAWMLFPWKCCGWNAFARVRGKENIYRNLWRRLRNRPLLYTHTDVVLFTHTQKNTGVADGCEMNTLRGPKRTFWMNIRIKRAKKLNM